MMAINKSILEDAILILQDQILDLLGKLELSDTEVEKLYRMEEELERLEGRIYE